jgi:hypothetical protein
MIKFDHLTSAQDLVRNANNDRDRLLVQLLTTMADKIHQLEMQVFEMTDKPEQLPVIDGDHKLVLSAIEENSYEAFSHIEAEIEEKLEGFLESHSFAEAVTDAVKGSLHGVVEEILDGIIADAITDALGDPEDIVRKGLRSIL